MRQFGLFEAKTKLSEICEGVARAREPVLITKRGKAWVRIVPIEERIAEPSVWQLRSMMESRDFEDFDLPPRQTDSSPDIFTDEDL